MIYILYYLPPRILIEKDYYYCKDSIEIIIGSDVFSSLRHYLIIDKSKNTCLFLIFLIFRKIIPTKSMESEIDYKFLLARSRDIGALMLKLIE